jgi:CRISPR-associated protein Csh2
MLLALRYQQKRKGIIVMNNSEILYLYDAQLTNPNGDPDEENRPRMDYERGINLVSDLRLKRYIRDYLLDRNFPLYVQSIDNKPVTAAERIKQISDTSDENLLNSFIDIRLFGATVPATGDSKSFIGPVQFNWGYSLNKVELLESSITSHFASSTTKGQGAIGKDYRVKYSFIAFSGVISGKRAEYSRLSESDLELLDEAMKKAIPLLATRSKVGQYPRFYMRVIFNDNETMLDDFRNYIKLLPADESLRSINECALECGLLRAYLEAHKDLIKEIKMFQSDELRMLDNGVQKKAVDIFSTFNTISV